MEKLAIIILSFLIFSSALWSQQDYFTITGKTHDIPNETVVYLYDGATERNIDSTVITDDHFFFKGKIADAAYKNLWIMSYVKPEQIEYKSLWVVNADMTFDATQGNFREATVTGSYLQDQDNELAAAVEPWSKKIDSLRHTFRTPSGMDEERLRVLKQEMESYQKAKAEAGVNFVREHPDYLISAFYLTFVKNEIPKEQTSELYDGLTDRIKRSSFGQVLKQWLELSVDLDKGMAAVDFTLPDLDGNRVSLSDFRGQYVLLEFGASGCAPCRLENPNLLKAYEQYREQGFEIVSIWLDKSRSSWEKTVAKDRMIWTTLSDLKGNDGPVPLTYDITYIPRNFLLNREGQIVETDLRGEALQQKLAGIFEKDRSR